MDYLYGFITGFFVAVAIYEFRKIKWYKKHTERTEMMYRAALAEYKKAKAARKQAGEFLKEMDDRLKDIKKLHIAEGARLSGTREK